MYSFAEKSNKTLGSKRRLVVLVAEDDLLTYMPYDTKLPLQDLGKLKTGNKGRMQASKTTTTKEASGKVVKVKGTPAGKDAPEEWQL